MCHPSFVTTTLFFSGFIYNGNLTALCQYCDLCYFPLVVEHKQKILSRIVGLFEQMKAQNALPFEACVMDFACLPDKTLVIEINPYVRVFTPPGVFVALSSLSALNSSILPVQASLTGGVTRRCWRTGR